MAIALVTSGGVPGAVSGISTAISGFATPVPAGSLIVMGFSNSGAANVTAASDNSTQAGAANAYTIRARLATNPASIQVIWCMTTRALLTTDTITLTHDSNSRRATRILVFSGVATSSPLDQSATAGATVGALTVGPTGALAATGEVAIDMVGWFGGTTASGAADTSGYTLSRTSSGGLTNTVEAISTFKLNVGVAAESDSMSFSSFTAVRGELLTFKAIPTGTLFTKSVSGAASFAGSATRPKVVVARKQPLAVMAATGVVVSHPTGRLVAGVFAPVGSTTRQATLARTLSSAALSFSGAVSTATARLRSLVGAVFAPTGTQTRIKAVSKSVSGALSFVGSQTHVESKQLAGVFAPVGVLGRALSLLRTVTAGLAPVGALSRFTSRKVTGTASWVGMVITNQAATHLAAVFRPTGAVTHGLPARTLFAALAATGSVARFTTRSLVSSLVASGVIHTQYIPPTAPTPPGGGGFGALMSDGFFARYQVDAKWRAVKRVKAR